MEKAMEFGEHLFEKKVPERKGPNINSQNICFPYVHFRSDAGEWLYRKTYC